MGGVEMSICASCNFVICLRCKRVHVSGTSCILDGDDEFHKIIMSLSYGQCPSCNNIIEKESGCNHMTCKCLTQFCYLCNKLWDDDHRINATCQLFSTE